MSITKHDRREGPVTKETASFSAPGVQSWLGPFNEGVIEGAEGRARVTGPCGDTMEITLRIHNESIVESRFLVSGCEVSSRPCKWFPTASAIVPCWPGTRCARPWKILLKTPYQHGRVSEY
ncbi:MAG: iron-sulfur cluster assembly scaffold protein [Desulfobacterota bacterium]|nr:iron-sulfur cluster assembly scaffold protein [Thermodesulfobacteriota bacterium]